MTILTWKRWTFFWLGLAILATGGVFYWHGKVIPTVNSIQSFLGAAAWIMLAYSYLRWHKRIGPLDKGSVITLEEGTPAKWAKCAELRHVPTTYQYGAHPSRVYQFCPFCHIKSRLDWKDTYARTMNRLWFSAPAIISAAFLLITIIVIIVSFG